MVPHCGLCRSKKLKEKWCKKSFLHEHAKSCKADLVSLCFASKGNPRALFCVFFEQYLVLLRIIILFYALIKNFMNERAITMWSSGVGFAYRKENNHCYICITNIASKQAVVKICTYRLLTRSCRYFVQHVYVFPDRTHLRPRTYFSVQLVYCSHWGVTALNVPGVCILKQPRIFVPYSVGTYTCSVYYSTLLNFAHILETSERIGCKVICEEGLPNNIYGVSLLHSSFLSKEAASAKRR